ncbi:MAG: hypothetical protein ACTSQ8_21710 [Candidatus Helarchaeota archaeon]
MAITKEDVRQKLEGLENVLKEGIGTRKAEIIEKVKQSQGGESEGVFTKTVLAPILHELFGDSVTIEGVEGSGTQFKTSFFGSSPAPDFVIEKPTNIMGEVKYADYGTLLVSHAIGQVLLYIAASKDETRVADFGCVIFFDKSLKYETLRPNEEKLIRELWDRSNIYLIIV